jgi:hypothetical protein
MTRFAQQIAQNKAAECKLQVLAHRQAFARQGLAVGQCAADGWDLCTETLNGEFDLDTPVGQDLLRRLIVQQPSVLHTLQTWEPSVPLARVPMRTTAPRPEDDMPPWLRDYLFGQWGGAGVQSEIRSASVGPGNIVGNGLAAAQTAAMMGMQGQTAARLNEASRQIATGASRTVRINQFMDLYNANQGKGAPRLRLRIRNLPVTVAAPIPGAQWRTNGKGTAHSTRWTTPTANQVRGAGTVAAENRWARSMGWSSGKLGTGLITFAPTAALDAWSSIEFDMNAAGKRHIRSFDTNKFLITSARNQSGNAVGLAASMASVPVAVAIAAGLGLTVAGAPLVLIGLATGIAVQVVWNAAGGADFAEDQARAALRGPR